MSAQGMTTMAKPTKTTVTPAADAATDTGADAILKTGFTDAQQDALTLMQTATFLIEAESAESVGFALDYNFKVWVAIRSLINADSCTLPEEVRNNLRSLAKYTVDTTLEAGQGTIEAGKLISLARIDILIAEGLLRAEQNRTIEMRAYQIWEEEGRPEGRSEEHWMRAEREISEAAKHLED